jgi:hypothetical protein
MGQKQDGMATGLTPTRLTLVALARHQILQGHERARQAGLLIEARRTEPLSQALAKSAVGFLSIVSTPLTSARDQQISPWLLLDQFLAKLTAHARPSQI